MHYFLFNNDIFVSAGRDIRRLRPEDRKIYDFSGVSTAHVCLVDVDVLVAVAPEEKPEQKDLVLSKEFSRLHPGEYIIQDERVGTNMFQVVGAKAEKVREIYGLLSGDRIVSFTPYAMAIRAFLNMQDLPPKRIVAFVDDLVGETLITFYEGLKFSQTRRFSENEIERILPEIRRSAIGFCKAIKRDNDAYFIMTNNPRWAQKIRDLDPGQDVCHTAVSCPAIEGLKSAQFPVKFELPEDVLKRTRDRDRRAKIPYFIAAGLMLFVGICFVLFYRISLAIQVSAYQHAERLHDSLENKLMDLDPEIYRSAIRHQKKLNYGEIYFWLQTMIPPAYEVTSLSYTLQGHSWVVQVILALPKGQAYEDIPISSAMGRKMTVQNVLVKDRPGKSIRIEL